MKEVCVLIKNINNMKKKTFYHLIVDKSGSMQDCIPSTLSGFNEQMQAISSLQQRFPDQEISVGFTSFNHQVDHHFLDKQPKQVLPLTKKNYKPEGSTAMLDAIGKTTELIREEMQTALTDLNNTVVVVIITDGYENASVLYTLQKINTLISSLEATEQWTFSFLGATPDAVDVARSMSIRTSNSMSFSKKQMKISVFNNLSDSMESYLDNKQHNRRTTDFLIKEEGE
jgi:hypothetical protein